MMEIAFGALTPAHQDLDGFRRRAPPVEDGGHLRGDWQLDPVALTERECRAGGADAFGDGVHAGEHVRQRPPATELDPDMTIPAQVTSTCEHEIAETAQPGERFPPATFGAGQSRDFGEAA